MNWIAVLFLLIILLGGVARLFLFLRSPIALLPSSERSLTGQKLLSLAMAGIACSIFGLILLYLELVKPFAAIIGVFLVVSLVEIGIRTVKRGD